MTYALLFLIIGIALLLLELMIPSAGVLTVLALTSLLAWVITAYVYGGALVGTLALLATAILLPIVFTIALKVWPQTPIGRAVLIHKSVLEQMTAPAGADERRALIGKVGQTVSPMRPSGAIEIAERVYNAMSEGMPIDTGQTVRVVDVLGKSLIVRPDYPAAGNAPADEQPGGEHVPLDRLITDPFDEPLA